MGPEWSRAKSDCESCGRVKGCYMTTALSCPLPRLPRLTNLTKHPGTSACPPWGATGAAGLGSQINWGGARRLSPWPRVSVVEAASQFLHAWTPIPTSWLALPGMTKEKRLAIYWWSHRGRQPPQGHRAGAVEVAYARHPRARLCRSCACHAAERRCWRHRPRNGGANVTASGSCQWQQARSVTSGTGRPPKGTSRQEKDGTEPPDVPLGHCQ